MPDSAQSVCVSGSVAVTIRYRSWDFDPCAAGQRAAVKHTEALRRLASDQTGHVPGRSSKEPQDG